MPHHDEVAKPSRDRTIVERIADLESAQRTVVKRLDSDRDELQHLYRALGITSPPKRPIVDEEG